MRLKRGSWISSWWISDGSMIWGLALFFRTAPVRLFRHLKNAMTIVGGIMNSGTSTWEKLSPRDSITGWWFGTFFLLFHTLGIIIPTDQYFSEGLKPLHQRVRFHTQTAKNSTWATHHGVAEDLKDTKLSELEDDVLW